MGKVNATAGKTVTLTFPHPFKSNNYSIVLTHAVATLMFDSCMPYATNKTTTSVTIGVWNGASIQSGEVLLNWIAVDNA